MDTIDTILSRTAPGSLLLGVNDYSDKTGRVSSSLIVDGTPAGFRMLADILVLMAEHVESGEGGWHLALSPEDLVQLKTVGVTSAALNCVPMKMP